MARLARTARWGACIVVLTVVTSLGHTEPAAAQPSPAATFQWHDPEMREAFQACMEMVDWFANGRPGDNITNTGGPHDRWSPPDGVDIQGRLWRDAVNWTAWDIHPFVYRPHCHKLLPDDYETRIPTRYWSEAFTRCVANVSGNGNYERPLEAVPAWYWEVSMEIGDCYLLLPLGAFGLGDDHNRWSRWTADDEIDYPEPDPDVYGADLVEEYNLCLEYIDWRMDNGEALMARLVGARPLGDIYDDPPRHASPRRVWHEAIDFYVDASADSHGILGSAPRTVPAEWMPNCNLLLLSGETCDPARQPDEGLLPDLCIGPHPISNYDIYYEQKNNLSDFDFSRTMWGGSTALAFQLTKFAIQVSLWAVDWAYTFDIEKYDVLGLDIGDRYQLNLLEHPRFNIRDLLWLILVGWAGWTALRGRLTMAGSEILFTVVLLLLATMLLQHRDRYMNATWDLMDEASTALLVAGTGGDPESVTAGSATAGAQRDELVHDLQAQIHEAFIAQPYDHLNWGRSLGSIDDPDNPLAACASARYYILSQAPSNTDPWPRQKMEQAGGECAELAEFNAVPTGTRLLGAILVLVSAVTVGILLFLMAMTIVLAKLIALLLFGLAPFAALLVRLPSYGRRLTWSWLTSLLQSIVAVIGMSFLLSLLLLALTSLIGLTGNVSMIERFVLMNLIVLVVFGGRRALLRGGQNLASLLNNQLTATRGAGAGASWSGTGAPSSRGVDLLAADRVAGWSTVAPLAVAGESVLFRYRERRMARRGYRNLQRLAYWKRRNNWMFRNTPGFGRPYWRGDQLP